MRFLLVVPQDFQGEPVPGMLHKYGVCDISSDPKETVFLCDCNEYDALILSASLEFEDCESLCREIRGQNDRICRVAFTALVYSGPDCGTSCSTQCVRSF